MTMTTTEQLINIIHYLTESDEDNQELISTLSALLTSIYNEELA